ncbi:hypothetical protein [Pontibacter sp. G13]|uniref:SRPBCC family protein n=1 Tax=Pontibacter sp. G13 TaxID=3074898 RepID=UPI00288AEA8E|nr:hypothetical protein [Pontibacter sp. G13]WNJ16149.1 hypothetical protein RJD25_14900 [Pontibacter sp. G13]
MNLLLKTPVSGNYQSVLAQFDLALLKQLTPPGADIEILRFDGSHKGDEVHIRVKLFGVVKQLWEVSITEEEDNGKEAWFTDEGRVIPSPLKTWKHRHAVADAGDHSVIIDDITYSTGSGILDRLIYPVMYAQFAGRAPIYQRIFGKPE